MESATLVYQMVNVSTFQRQEIKKYIADRHYYLKQARQSIRLKQISEMHTFCKLAETAQEHLDLFAKWYGIQNIVR